MTDKLKPCKYCGGKPELVKVGDWKEHFAYQCSHCHKFHARHSEARRTPWGAKRIWNRRADNDK